MKQQQISVENSDLRTVSRLKWQCRRGMLELDLMLQAFMDKQFAGLSSTQLQAFEELLSYPDQLLLEYLMGQTVPFNKEVADVAKQIRDAAGP